MRLLLDTHVFLWMVQDKQKVPATFRQKLDDPASDIYFSAVLSWEIATKRAKGKLHFSGSPLQAAAKAGLFQLPITAQHCESAGELDPHHSDPFDRLLVAQAEAEGLVLATVDPVMRLYGIPLLMP